MLLIDSGPVLSLLLRFLNRYFLSRPINTHQVIFQFLPIQTEVLHCSKFVFTTFSTCMIIFLINPPSNKSLLKQICNILGLFSKVEMDNVVPPNHVPMNTARKAATVACSFSLLSCHLKRLTTSKLSHKFF